MSIEDKAQEHEAAMWATVNMNRKGLPPLKKPGDPGYGPAECEECGAEMPALRRANGWILCTPCQTLVEQGRLRRD